MLTKHLFHFLLLSLTLFSINSSSAAIRSNTGTLQFDSNSDGDYEVQLSANGLAIGLNLTASANLEVQGNALISNNLDIGGTGGNSMLNIHGTLGYGIETTSSNVNISANSYVLADSSSGNITLTLPYAGNMLGRVYTIKKTSSLNEVHIKANKSFIDYSESLLMSSSSSFPSIKLISSGTTRWSILESNSTTTSDFLYSASGNAPALDLTFAASTTLDDAITFSRASTGSYIDSDGLIKSASINTARFQYDPQTGESLGLLIEEQKTNLLEYSEEMDNGAEWTIYTAGNVTANTASAPDGTTTAESLVRDGANTKTSINHNAVTIVIGNDYVQSCYVKIASGTAQFVHLWSSNGHSGSVNFDLSTGTYNISNVSTIKYAGMQALANGWYRIYLCFNSTTNNITFRLSLADSLTAGRNSDFSGTGGIYLWGAQLEEGDSISSYIKTGVASATRSADSATITGTDFSNFYSATTGTIFSQYISNASGIRGILSIDDNSTNEILELITSDTNPTFNCIDGGASQASIDAGTVSGNVTENFAISYATNDFSASEDSGTAVTDTSGTLPTVDRMRIGVTQSGNYLNGTISRITYWTQRLSDSVLSTITTK